MTYIGTNVTELKDKCPRCLKDVSASRAIGLSSAVQLGAISTIFGVTMCKDCWKQVVEQAVARTAFEEKEKWSLRLKKFLNIITSK